MRETTKGILHVVVVVAILVVGTLLAIVIRMTWICYAAALAQIAMVVVAIVNSIAQADVLIMIFGSIGVVIAVFGFVFSKFEPASGR